MAPGVAFAAPGEIVRFGTLEFTATPEGGLRLEPTLMPFQTL
jgi:hypothetical protein